MSDAAHIADEMRRLYDQETGDAAHAKAMREAAHVLAAAMTAAVRAGLKVKIDTRTWWDDADKADRVRVSVECYRITER